MTDKNQDKLHTHWSWTGWFGAIHIFGVLGIVYVLYALLGSKALPSELVPAENVWVLATVIFGYVYLRVGLYSVTLVHRAFAHSAFTMTKPLQCMVTLGFHSALQAPVWMWVGWHRKHHNPAVTDTSADRHSPVFYGLWHSHMGWVLKRELIKPTSANYFRRLPSSVLKLDKFYWMTALSMAFALPTLVCGLLWGDWIGGFLFAGCTRLVFLYHLTWTINSLMHTWGEREEGAGSATNTRSTIFAFLVVGEPSHANHHKNPGCYRFNQDRPVPDPGARLIEILCGLGLARIKGPILS